MRVALYQCPPLPLDVSANLQRLQRLAMEAAGADVLVLPEMYLTGYNIGAAAVAALAQPCDGAWAQEIAALARTQNMAIVYGYPERAENTQLYNAVQVIDAQGTRLCNYRKTHLFGELDRLMFSAGAQASRVVELNGWKIGLLICYDLEFPENARQLAQAGAELILVPTANMQPYEFIANVTVLARAFENQCYLAYANYCGAEDSIHYCGLSSLVAPDGRPIAWAGQGEELIIGTLSQQVLEDSRAANPYLRDRRPELYVDLIKK
jgi:predicted amidohydrolase